MPLHHLALFMPPKLHPTVSYLLEMSFSTVFYHPESLFMTTFSNLVPPIAPLEVHLMAI